MEILVHQPMGSRLELTIHTVHPFSSRVIQDTLCKVQNNEHAKLLVSGRARSQYVRVSRNQFLRCLRVNHLIVILYSSEINKCITFDEKGSDTLNQKQSAYQEFACMV